MPSTGPNSPGTLASDAAVGNVAWTNPSNAATSNNTYATSALTPGQTTQYLKATNFGFAVSGTVLGIAAEYEGNGPSSLTELTVKLVKAGAVVGHNKGAGATVPTSDAYRSFGDASDLWSTTWNADEVNAADFGVVFQFSRTGASGTVTMSVDHVRITVTTSSGASTHLLSGHSLSGGFDALGL